MKRVLKWAGYGLAGVVGLSLVVIGCAFGVSEAMIRWPADRPQAILVASTDPGAVARGRKIATVQGCHDCHGAGFQGVLFHDEPAVVRAWAPNLTLAAAGRSDADLDRAIRHGVGFDGRRLWIMPSSAFAHLTDQETADLVAYVRTFRPAGGRQPDLQIGPVGRLGVLLGKFRSEPALIAAGGPGLADAGVTHAAGRDLARACVECHGQALEGGADMGAPDLTIAAFYDREDFERLLRTGVAAGGRKLGLMSEVAPARFNAWTSQEIGELHDYLKTRARRQLAAADAAAASVQQP